MAKKRQIFYSFHYEEDSHRASQVRNIGVVEGNKPVSSNDWEEVKRGGDTAIKKWIDEQMKGRSCTVVLAGTKTANRKWINYEIEESWKREMGVVGIYIHGLKNLDGYTSSQGDNPFNYVFLGNNKLSGVFRCHLPFGANSKEIYAWIKDNLSDIVEQAIFIKDLYLIEERPASEEGSTGNYY